MNSIMMVVGAVIAVLIVFIIFSQDEMDDETEEYQEEAEAEERPAPDEPKAPPAEEPRRAPPPPVVEKPAAPAVTAKAPPPTGPVKDVEPGTEEDFRLRFTLNDQLPPVTGVKTAPAVACVVQFRFPEISQIESGSLAGLINLSEKVLSSEELPFPFEVFLNNQTDRLLLFGFEEERDDAVLEALVTANEIISRFKKLLENNRELLQVKARLAIGVAQGAISRVLRGPVGPLAHAGKPVYLAETFAESAGDFQIYVDEDTHKQAMPLFDFREWKPTRLRQSLPPIPFFELVGWNKKEEIFAFASHSEAFARRAVAIAYRYLDFDDMAPLLGLVSDPDEKVALDALSTVSEIGDDRALGILKKFLPEARNSTLRSAIIEALGKVGKEEVVPALLASTKDVNWLVRFKAVKSLYKISKGEILKHIEYMTEDEDGAVRAAIHQILYRESHKEKDLEALRGLLKDLSLRARKAAAEALIEIGTKDSLLMVARSFAEQEPEVRRHILKLITKAKANVLYQCFLTMFYAADPRDHADIVAAIRRAQLMN